MEHDILRPQLVWLNGSCYRKNPLKTVTNSYNGGDVADDYGDENIDDCALEDEYGCNSEETFGNQCAIEENNGRFSCRLQIASSFYAIIIGKKAATKKRIEQETKTQINIPRQVNTRIIGSCLKLIPQPVWLILRCTDNF